MENSRTKNSSRNIFSGLLNKGIILLFPFIIRYLIIKNLGTDYLGLNSLFTSILQVLNLAELGFGSAIVYSMYKPIAESDKKTICALLNLYKKIYRIIGISIFIIGIILIPFLDKLISGSYPSDINLAFLYFLYLINVAITYFLFAYKSSLLIAHQRSDIVSNVMTITNLLQYLLQVVILIVFNNYYLFIVVNIFTNILNNIIVAIIAKKKYPDYYCTGEIDQKIKKSIRKRVLGLMIQKICATTRNSFDSIFISSFLGLSILAKYSNYYTIMHSIIGIMSIFSNAILASVGNSIVKESKNKNYRDMCKFNFAYMWISGWCAICLLCLYQPFTTIWLGDDFLLPFSVVILFPIYFYSLKMGDIRAIYSDANGLWWENRYRALVESIVNILLNYFLGKIFGLYGIIIATLISLFVINFVYGSRILFKNYFGMEMVRDYYIRHAKYFCITFFISIITYFFCSIFSCENDIMTFGVRCLICIIVPNLLYLFVYYKSNDFKDMIKFSKKVISTIRNK